MSDDNIKRSDAIEALEKLSACKEHGEEIGTEEETYIGKYEAITALSDLPSADRPQGKWIEHERAEEVNGMLISNYECSYCHEWERKASDYCPNCGCRMKGADDDTD